ncbi:hypothetical protein PFMALIP_01149 [Plasmodium falciparum MaliPS096_E11]|uniref:PRP28/DDX23-like helical domain-containing protein n=1 Tax=Plasmodium falciparum MaliPS096_E11 TaxID=1036727 RepID=A0A024WUB5_PLAFA|nr:hypothetical protein PFMALIP_01149 [Plasmodium falciparum MaliPS096_E11]
MFFFRKKENNLDEEKENVPQVSNPFQGIEKESIHIKRENKLTNEEDNLYIKRNEQSDDNDDNDNNDDNDDDNNDDNNNDVNNNNVNNNNVNNNDVNNDDVNNDGEKRNNISYDKNKKNLFNEKNDNIVHSSKYKKDNQTQEDDTSSNKIQSKDKPKQNEKTKFKTSIKLYYNNSGSEEEESNDDDDYNNNKDEKKEKLIKKNITMKNQIVIKEPIKYNKYERSDTKGSVRPKTHYNDNNKNNNFHYARNSYEDIHPNNTKANQKIFANLSNNEKPVFLTKKEREEKKKKMENDKQKKMISSKEKEEEGEGEGERKKKKEHHHIRHSCIDNRKHRRTEDSYEYRNDEHRTNDKKRKNEYDHINDDKEYNENVYDEDTYYNDRNNKKFKDYKHNNNNNYDDHNNNTNDTYNKSQTQYILSESYYKKPESSLAELNMLNLSNIQRDNLKEKELEIIKQQYLGLNKTKKKIQKPSEKFRNIFNFEWDQSEDTSRNDSNPLYQNRLEPQLLFGRGYIAGIDVREQRKKNNFYDKLVQNRLNMSLNKDRENQHQQHHHHNNNNNNNISCNDNSDHNSNLNSNLNTHTFIFILQKTVIGLTGKDYVILAADTRLSLSYSIYTRFCPKISKL